MKAFVSLLLFILTSCTHHPSPAPEKKMASDSIAEGKVAAVVEKATKAQELCFHINLSMKDVNQEYAEGNNWTIVWIDTDGRYHLLKLQQRGPASTTSTEKNVWTNTFSACDAKQKFEKFDSLLLSPKTLPFRESDGLKLQWK